MKYFWIKYVRSYHISYFDIFFYFFIFLCLDFDIVFNHISIMIKTAKRIKNCNY